MSERMPDGGKTKLPVKQLGHKPAKRRRSVAGSKAVSVQRQAERDAALGAGLSSNMQNPLVAPESASRAERSMRGASVVDTSTAEGRAEFRSRATRNFQFFCRNVAVIKPKGGGKLQLLRWNKAQQRLALTLIGQHLEGKPMMAVVAKARQWGCSTLLTALASWKMLTTEGYGVCLVIHDKQFLPEFRDKYQLILSTGCRVFGLRVVADNADGIRLSNGSRIDFYAAGTKQNSEKIRSATYNFAHLTEIPYWYDVHKTMGTVTAAVDLVRGNGICIESTPRGRGDQFHQLYTASKQGKIGYAPMFVPWHELETYTVSLTDGEAEAVRNYLAGGLSTRVCATMEREFGLVPDKDGRVERFNLSPQQYVWWCRTFRDKAHLVPATMATEYPDDDETCFLTSGSTVLSGEQLRDMADVVTEQRDLWKRGVFDRDGRFSEMPGGWFEMLEEPVEGVKYIFAADIAQGSVDGDYTCFGVGRRVGNTLKIVAGMYAHCDTAEAAGRAKLICDLYGDPLVIPEANGPGVAFILDARRIGIKNIWVRRKVNSVTGGVDDKLGIQTTASTKPSMIAALKKKVRSKELVCGWAPVYVDLSSFCWSDAGCTTAKAVRGAHDDGAMMLAIMCYGFENSPDMGAPVVDDASSPADFLSPKPAEPDYAIAAKDHDGPQRQPAPRQYAGAPSFLDLL